MSDCRLCGKKNEGWERFDHHGIYTTRCCDTCYDDPTKYTWRKDDYFDPAYAGESLDENY